MRKVIAEWMFGAGMVGLIFTLIYMALFGGKESGISKGELVVVFSSVGLAVLAIIVDAIPSRQKKAKKKEDKWTIQQFANEFVERVKRDTKVGLRMVLVLLVDEDATSSCFRLDFPGTRGYVDVKVTYRNLNKKEILRFDVIDQTRDFSEEPSRFGLVLSSHVRDVNNELWIQQATASEE